MLVRLLFNITCAVLTLHLLWLLATHAIRCYVSSRPVRLRSLLTDPARLRLFFAVLCQELAALLLLSMLWLFPARRVRRPVETRAGNPVLLIPGYGIQRGSMWFLSWWLRQKGWGTVVAPLGPAAGLFGSASRSIEELASRLGQAVECVVADTGARQVDLIGQGLGGLVARYYVEQMGRRDRVSRLITLGTAHHGTGLACFGEALAESMGPESPMMGALEASLQAVGAALPYTSIAAELDGCVLPATSAVLGGPHRDICLEGVGHHALAFSGRAWQQIRGLLEAPRLEPLSRHAGAERSSDTVSGPDQPERPAGTASAPGGAETSPDATRSASCDSGVAPDVPGEETSAPAQGSAAEPIQGVMRG